VDSAYNERRSQCEQVSAVFGVPALRDVTAEQLQVHAHDLDDVALRRARHVITENERTVTAASVLAAGDGPRMGELMNASHASLRDDFEVSSEALDLMVECARSAPGCHGARMTGAGFGGCAVALVEATQAAQLAQSVAGMYHTASGHEPQVYVCCATNGAGVV
jgi:galactokinase